MERSTQKIYELGRVDEEDLCNWARVIGDALCGGELLLLKGELGSGKTRFVRFLAESLGIKEEVVRSPSFTIVNVYPGTDLALVHVDLFRLRSVDEIWDTGLMEMLDRRSVMAIEWPDLIMEDLQKEAAVVVELRLLDISHRLVKITVDAELDHITASIDEYFDCFSGGS